MKPEEIAAIKALAEAATAGPWTSHHRASDRTSDDDECAGGLGLQVDGPPEAWGKGQFHLAADAAFIAAAREAVPALIADLERARELLRVGQGYGDLSNSEFNRLADDTDTYLEETE